jgi:hypothetical protein
MNDMNEDTLKQWHFFRWHTYKILDNGVELKEVTLLRRIQSFIPFEGISEKPNEVTVYSKPFLCAMLIFWLLTVAVSISFFAGGDTDKGAPIVWGVLGVFFTLLYLASKERYLIFRTNKNIESLVIFKDIPNKTRLTQFLDRIQSKKHEYLKKTYFTGPVESNSVDAIQKLLTLKELGALTEEEFDKLKAEVIKKAEFGGSMPLSTN